MMKLNFSITAKIPSRRKKDLPLKDCLIKMIFRNQNWVGIKIYSLLASRRKKVKAVALLIFTLFPSKRLKARIAINAWHVKRLKNCMNARAKQFIFAARSARPKIKLMKKYARICRKRTVKLHFYSMPITSRGGSFSFPRSRSLAKSD